MQQLKLLITKQPKYFMKRELKHLKLCHEKQISQQYKKGLRDILQQKKKDLNEKYKPSEEQVQIYQLLKYFCNKLGLNKIFDKEQHYVQQKLFILHSNFSQYSNLNCYGCKQIFVRGFLKKQMDHFQFQTLKPYKYLLIKQITYQQIRNIICAAANSQTGSGTIIFVNTLQNNTATGITEFKQNQKKLLQQKISRSLESINDSQSINVKVNSITLSNYTKQYKQIQFVIKMDIITQSFSNGNKLYKKLYYIQKQRIKGQKKKQQSYQLVKDELDKIFNIKKIQMDKFYQSIHKRNKRFIVKQPIKQKCQLFKRGDQLQSNIKSPLKNIRNHQLLIPKIYQWQEVFLLQIINNPYPNLKQFEIGLYIQGAKFKKYKLNLFKIELQLLQRHRYPTAQTQNKQFYCIFQVNQSIKKLINLHRNLFVKNLPIQNILSIRRKLFKQEYDYYYQIIFEKYNIQPLMQKRKLQSKMQQYLVTKLQFPEQNKDASLYSYLFFEFIQRYPMFSKS